MRACGHASADEMQTALAAIGPNVEAQDVRAPESGLVMLRGRVGGTGDAFNVGEVTVTRAVVRLSNGTLGYSYLLGRAKIRARLAAILDGCCQGEVEAALLEEKFTRPVLARVAQEQMRRTEEAAATRVDFFTLVRGEDA
jgi:alpha-D-ribose 1-methylphosphonate 5-triphosphate synthase subunit PhnG